MAADVIFTEGSDAAATAGRQVETARLAEHQALRPHRGRDAAAAGHHASAPPPRLLRCRPPADTGQPRSQSPRARRKRHVQLNRPLPGRCRRRRRRRPPNRRPATAGELFRAAADLATDFGRVRDLEESDADPRPRGRPPRRQRADGLDGHHIGRGSAPGPGPRLQQPDAGADSAVSRSANNAAASAYRSGTLQIVLSRPGVSTGAVVAPILSADGCIGALSAEIRGGGETSELVQAFAAIFASHLAGVLAMTPTADISEPRAATSA